MVSKPKTTDSAEKLKGSVKEAIGKLIGDGKIEAEGKAEQISAKADAKPKTTSKP
nr:CsbD family protein [Methylobacterium sp. Leaf466]